MSDTEELSERLIAQRAAEWFVANRSDELSAEERTEFVAWLKASPMHMREYLAIAGVSGDLGEVVTNVDIDLDVLLRAAAEDQCASVVPLRSTIPGSSDGSGLAPRVTPRRAWARAGAIAAGLCAIGITGALTLRDGERFGLPRTYETAHAEQTSWRLPDGSVMHLNSDSRATVRFSHGERLIDLDRGQAHFQVTRDPQRRFRVATDRVDVIAVGTAFDVYRRPETTIVTVVEGKVAVVQLPAAERKAGGGAAQTAHSLDVQPNANADTSEHGRVDLTAGQRVEMNASTTATPDPIQVDLRESAAWLQRQIVFEQQRLEDVAAEFNRYSRTPLEIEDAELKNLRLSGAFNAYDMDSFVGFLQRLDNVVIESGPSRIEVHRERADTDPTQK